MSDAPERISLELLQGMADDFWSECRDPRYAKSAPVAYVRADRLEAQEALLREAMAALHQYVNDMRYPPERDSRDRRIAWAQATLAKLRAHLEGEKE